MTTPTAQSTSRKANKAAKSIPSTVLTLTLNTDGSGSLITRRGDLAAIHQFTYRDLRDIVTAIQRGAAHLIEVENDPPPKELTAAPAANHVEITRPPTTDSPEAEATVFDESAAVASATDQENLVTANDESTLPGNANPSEAAQMPLL
jgi:hypothetical protein